MTEAANTEERDDEQEHTATYQEFDLFITPEYIAQEEERRRKEKEEKEAFDTNIFLQSSSQPKQTASEQLQPPATSPPKDPTPPASSSSSHNESSSESSPEHSSPTPSETASKQQSINEPAKPVDLQEQVNTLTTLVTNLAKQVEDFQESKQKIDKFLKADLEGIIKTFTYDYLTENLVEIVTLEVTNLIQPISNELEHRIRSGIKKLLSTTSFTLHPVKAINQLQPSLNCLSMTCLLNSTTKLPTKPHRQLKKKHLLMLFLPTCLKSRAKKLLEPRKGQGKMMTQTRIRKARNTSLELVHHLQHNHAKVLLHL